MVWAFSNSLKYNKDYGAFNSFLYFPKYISKLADEFFFQKSVYEGLFSVFSECRSLRYFYQDGNVSCVCFYKENKNLHWTGVQHCFHIWIAQGTDESRSDLSDICWISRTRESNYLRLLWRILSKPFNHNLF